MMRRERVQTQQQMDSAQADTILEANKELEKQVAQLQLELKQVSDGQKALVLQRKTLIQGKESVSKELEKVLKKTETQGAE